jgi:hypothetical protein
MLDQVLWRDLVGADAIEAFGTAWLGLACGLIPGALRGTLLLALDTATSPNEVAKWPAEGRPDTGLVSAAQLAIKEGRGVVQPAPANSQQPTRIAYPIALDDRVVGAVALDIDAALARDPREHMRQLQWAVAWVKDFMRRAAAAADRETMGRAGLALDLLAAALEEETFASACRVAATELATRFGCERVSFGFLVRGQSQIAGISHSAHFGKRMNLVRQLADAMDEAIDQHAVVLFPPVAEDDAILVRAHAALAAGHGAAFILTVPMFVKDRFVGALTMERTAAQPFEQATVDIAEAVGSILGSALVDKRDNDRWVVFKCVDAVANQAARLLGPGHIGRKLSVVGVAAVTLFLAFATGDYRVVATGQVEGAVRRSVAAPFDGFISEAPDRAGDVVHSGDLLAALDTRDLTLERLRWVTERQQHLYEYDQALGKRERADALKAQSLIDQAQAQVRLVDEQLARSRLTAPFDGLVVSGDLTQSIGAAVRRGDVLFEIAPLEGYRVELKVHESQIADVAPGQPGELLVAALPDTAFPFTVDRITPVATAHEGNTYFQVDGRLTEVSERLRPGMEGVGKVMAGTHRLGWIWFRSVLHWVRITTWRWLP